MNDTQRLADTLDRVRRLPADWPSHRELLMATIEEMDMVTNCVTAARAAVPDNKRLTRQEAIAFLQAALHSLTDEEGITQVSNL